MTSIKFPIHDVLAMAMLGELQQRGAVRRPTLSFLPTHEAINRAPSNLIKPGQSVKDYRNAKHERQSARIARQRAKQEARRNAR